MRKAQMALLLAKKVTILAKYLDFVDVFLEESLNILSEQTGVNEHIIRLKKGKESPYGPIYNLRPVELKTFKTYIKTKLANGFIRALKLPTSPSILLICKPNGIFCLYINY